MNKQQLRAQIAALQDATMDENKNFRTAYDEGKFDALTAVDALLDSLQEEPVAPKVLEDMLNAKTAAESLGISQEEHDRIVDELIYGKEPELVDDLSNKEKEPVNRTPADIKAAMQEVQEKSKSFTEAHQGESFDEILAQMRGEEPVSEDLETFAKRVSRIYIKQNL